MADTIGALRRPIVTAAELAKDALGEIPKFFVSFTKLAVSPAIAVKELGLFSEDELPNALRFFAISLIVALVLTVPVINQESAALYLASDGIWKIVLVM